MTMTTQIDSHVMTTNTQTKAVLRVIITWHAQNIIVYITVY